MENKAICTDRMSTLLAQSNLPIELRKVNPEYLKPGIRSICENMRAFTSGGIYLYGPGRGKSTNAAALLLNYLNLYRYTYAIDDVGYYISGYDLCRFNRVMDRYNKEDAARNNQVFNRIKNTKCLIVDYIFPTLNHNDAILFNAIYDMRQYCGGLTIYTSMVLDPLECASTPLYRIARDATHKEIFTC